jgi:hypothetical protein
MMTTFSIKKAQLRFNSGKWQAPPDVAARRQTAANLNGNANGGALPSRRYEYISDVSPCRRARGQWFWFERRASFRV